jgi:hypothetical protein
MLIPAVAPPSAQLLSAMLRASHYANPPRPSRTSLYLTARVFFEQPALSTGPVMLPAHLMLARLESAGSVGSLRCRLSYRIREYTTVSHGLAAAGQPPVVVPAPTIVHGVISQQDGVVITGPGTLTVTASADLDGDLRSALVAAGPVQLQLSFGVAGIDHPIRLDAPLDYVSGEPDAQAIEWRLNLPADDPWVKSRD